MSGFPCVNDNVTSDLKSVNEGVDLGKPVTCWTSSQVDKSLYCRYPTFVLGSGCVYNDCGLLYKCKTGKVSEGVGIEDTFPISSLMTGQSDFSPVSTLVGTSYIDRQFEKGGC